MAQCARCGAGVCASCANETSVTRGTTGVLCIDCYCEEISDLIEVCKKDARKRLTRVIISIITYVFGIIAICGGIGELLKGGNDGLPIIMVGVLCCGFYTGLTWRKAAQQSHEDYERTHGVTYNITADGRIERQDGFFMKLIFFLIGTVLGVIITPIRVIIDLVERGKSKKSVKTFEGMIEEARQV
ncbi:MAG: hypothetical protein K2L72_00575 [Clostridia bacterium]|nr:hypothetical protein [Clostridia bacterium]